MESLTWMEGLSDNKIKAFLELTKGQKSTRTFGEMFDWSETVESDFNLVNGVVTQNVGVFGDSLSILSYSDLDKITLYQNDMGSLCFRNDQKLEDSRKSVKTVLSVKRRQGCYKRRKNISVITKIASVLADDGHVWRKYGQKTILNSKHERRYYRCTYKFDQGCLASKQVQMINDEPSKYKITYHGHHTCNKFQIAPQFIVEASCPIDNSVVLSFETNTIMNGDKVDSCFRSMKHKPKDGLPSLALIKDEQIPCVDHHTLWDSIDGPSSQIPSEPMSMISSELDFEDMVYSGLFSSTCSTHSYEIDGDMSRGYSFDFFYQ